MLSSTPIQNIFIIHTSPLVTNSNKQRLDKTLVGAEIRTYELWVHTQACYKLSYAASLLFQVIETHFLFS
jgi:hypothetical protein